MLGGLTLRLGLFSRVYQLHKRKHIKILCIHECDSAGSSPAGGWKDARSGTTTGEKRQEETCGESEDFCAALPSPEILEAASLVELQSCGGGSRWKVG